MICLTQIFLYVPGYLNSILKKKAITIIITILPSLPMNLWEQHSPGWAWNPAGLNGVTLGWSWQRWHFSVPALGLSFGVFVPAGQVSAREQGELRLCLPGLGCSDTPWICAFALKDRGYQAEGLSAWLLGLTEVGCDGLLWLFAVLIAEVDLFPSFLCGSPSHQDSKSWTEGICWRVV